MKKRFRTFFYGIIWIILLPVTITLLFQGEALLPEHTSDGGSVIETEETENKLTGEDIEGEVVAILAAEISVAGEEEAIKAQAVIARTNLIGTRLTGTQEPESLTTAQMMEQFGEADFKRCYERLYQCVRATKGLVMQYKEKLIEAPYFAVSAGTTRSAKDAFLQEDVAYLQSTDSAEDVAADGYLQVKFVEKDRFYRTLLESYPDAGLTEEADMAQLETLSYDDGGYVKEIRVGNKTVSGEEFRSALKLRSACFSIREIDGSIRIVTKGCGHCVGLSQFGANELAKQGSSYEDILKKYYKDIKITEYKNAE